MSPKITSIGVIDPDGRQGAEGPLFLGFTVCPAPTCRKTIILVGGGEVIPGGGGMRISLPVAHTIYPPRRPERVVAKEVPAKYAGDFTEALAVLPTSAKASAALSRRCLQLLLHEEFKITEPNLAKEIDALIAAKVLPSYIADNVDAVRQFGNFAAHPIEDKATASIVDVEPEEAEWTLTVLEELFDFLFVEPAKAKARRDALDAKLKAAGKPPMK
jgi:hypothetical protein